MHSEALSLRGAAALRALEPWNHGLGAWMRSQETARSAERAFLGEAFRAWTSRSVLRQCRAGGTARAQAKALAYVFLSLLSAQACLAMFLVVEECARLPDGPT